ncbi:MAG: discoidin domain-containing protein [Candidatus Bathyarchaeia archaeon]
MRGSIVFSEKSKLRKNSLELIVLIVFFIFSLRVINWFEHPYILCSGDLRPPLSKEAFTKRTAYVWDNTDFGLPSIYVPRILNPFFLIITFFQSFGADLYFSQIIAVFLMYFVTSILMYNFVKVITNGDTVASFTAAIFLTANVFLINDREVTAIEFIGTTLMVLPCILMFSKALKLQSYKLMAISGMLCVLTYATFPNYRTTLICLIMLCLILLFFLIGNGIRIEFHRKISIKMNFSLFHMEALAIFAIAFLLTSIWVFNITFSNFDLFIGTYRELSTPWFIGGREIHFVMRLIARWGFDSGALGSPYLPYKDVYLKDPLMVFLSFLPVIIAFMSMLLPKNRKLAIFFGIFAIIFLTLTSGFSFIKYGESIYFDLMGLPLLKSFREASNWIFFVVICFAILIGYSVSTFCQAMRNRTLKVLIICAFILLFSYISYPLTTGDVARNWLNPHVKGSYLPISYKELDNMLPNNYWNILFPQRSTYVVYNFSNIPFACGNPYPLIFSKPIITGCGTEYLKSPSLEIINKIYKYALTEIEQTASLKGRASASSNETDEFTPDKAIDGNRETRWSSKIGCPQWFEIEWDNIQKITRLNVFFESAYADDYNIDFWDGSAWTTIINIKNNTSTRVEHVFLQPITTTKLRLVFTRASSFGSVSIWEVEVYAETEALPKFLGMLGIKNIVLEKNIIYGNCTSPNELKHKLRNSESFRLIKEWEEIELYENRYALQRIYAADNIINHVDIDEMYEAIEYLEWDVLNHTVFASSSVLNEALSEALVMPENLVWEEISPTNYNVNVYSRGPFILVLLESYSSSWKLRVNDKLIPETNHFMVNSYANGWIVNETGNLTLYIYYETQETLKISVIASVIAPTSLIMALSRRELHKAAQKISGRVKRVFRNLKITKLKFRA